MSCNWSVKDLIHKLITETVAASEISAGDVLIIADEFVFGVVTIKNVNGCILVEDTYENGHVLTPNHPVRRLLREFIRTDWTKD